MKQPKVYDKQGAAAAAPRGSMLREASEAIGVRWALDYSASVELTGRRIEGEWPGTLPEARGRVLASLPKQLSETGVAPLSAEEIALATAMTSAEAKRRWRIAAKRRPQHEDNVEPAKLLKAFRP